MKPEDYLTIAVRRKWTIIVTILFVLLGASVYYMVTPQQFKSSTTIMVVPQRVPEKYVASTVATRIEDRLSTIQQQIMSRTRLLAVINELDLFKERRGGSFPDALVPTMRNRIEILVVRKDAFTLSFSHEDPKTAMLTASRLASFFIEENLKTREQQAIGTSEFLESQLRDTKARLMAQEEKVKRYKMAYLGELPQELQSNLQKLSRLQEQLRINAQSIQTAEEKKALIEEQSSARNASAIVGAVRNGQQHGKTLRDPVEVLQVEIANRKAMLASLVTQYTDRYPEVVKLRNEVEILEKKIAEIQGSPPQREKTINIPAEENLRSVPLQLINRELETLKHAGEEITKKIAALEAKVAQAPQRELEMISLTRDYENLKKSYDDLLNKKLEAEISQNLELRQKGEQFQILDQANLPVTPFMPDPKKVFTIGFIVACALGFGGAFGLELLDKTLHNAKEYKHFFDLPIMGIIPVLQTRESIQRKTIRKFAVLGGIVSFAVAATVIFLMY